MRDSEGSSFEIRDAAPGDEEAAARAHILAWKQTYRGMMPDSLLDSLDDDLPRRVQIWRSMVTQPVPLSCCLVVERNSQVIGFAFGGTSRDDDAEASTGELGGIYLLKEHQGKGIGKALHDQVLERLKASDFRSATLWVLDKNLRTRRWYERQGWADDHQVKLDPRGDVVLREVRYRKPLTEKALS